MREELGVGEVPQATSIVGHHVGLASDVVLGGNVAMTALVQRVHAEEVGARCDGCGRADG